MGRRWIIVVALACCTVAPSQASAVEPPPSIAEVEAAIEAGQLARAYEIAERGYVRAYAAEWALMKAWVLLEQNKLAEAWAILNMIQPSALPDTMQQRFVRLYERAEKERKAAASQPPPAETEPPPQPAEPIEQSPPAHSEPAVTVESAPASRRGLWLVGGGVGFAAGLGLLVAGQLERTDLEQRLTLRTCVDGYCKGPDGYQALVDQGQRADLLTGIGAGVALIGAGGLVWGLLQRDAEVAVSPWGRRGLSVAMRF